MSILSEVINIEDEATLKQLNNLIVAKLNNIRDNRNLTAMSRFRVYDKVSFEGKNGRTIRGRITKINQKTINVDTPQGSWRVAPSFLRSDNG